MRATVISEQEILTRRGPFHTRLYRGADGSIGAALWLGNVSGTRDVLCRLHSSCFTSEALGALDCDCVEQFDMGLQAIANRQCGVTFYLLQEGRGAGLLSKARDRMVVQSSQGTIDTFAAYEQFGIEADPRHYELVPAICADLGITSLQLLTNNPAKVENLKSAGLAVEMVHLPSASSPYNSEYLTAKARSGHAFNAPSMDNAVPPSGVEAGDPKTERFGRFVRIASYDVPIRIAGESVWFRATAYSDEVGGYERLILSYQRHFQAAPVLHTFRDHLLERLAGRGEAARHYRKALKRIVDRGTGSVLAIPDDAAWLSRDAWSDVNGEMELLRRHAQTLRDFEMD